MDNLPGFAASIIVEVMYIPVHVQMIPLLCYINDKLTVASLFGRFLPRAVFR